MCFFGGDMSQVSLRVLRFMLLLLCLGMLSACGDEEKPPIVAVDCKIDTDCASFEQCTSNGTCIERTSCEDATQCKDGKACVGNQCVAAQCSKNDDCALGSEC